MKRATKCAVLIYLGLESSELEDYIPMIPDDDDFNFYMACYTIK